MSSSLRRRAKGALQACCLVAVAPAAALCALERRISRQDDAMFTFCAQAFALVPGPPGVFLRCAFYRLTLDDCAQSFFIGFGALFSRRHVSIEEGVYIGPYAVVGSARLRRGCLVGTRSSIVSGTQLHSLDGEGRWLSTDTTRMQQIEIGEYAWIGEGSIVMADIGASAMVGAGSVVSSRVPSRVVVAGNPARFARRLLPEDEEERRSGAKSVSIR